VVRVDAAESASPRATDMLEIDDAAASRTTAATSLVAIGRT